MWVAGAGQRFWSRVWSRIIDQRSIQHRTFRHFSFSQLLPIPAAPHCPARPRLLAALSPASDRRHRDPALPVIRSRRPSASSPNNNSRIPGVVSKQTPTIPTDRQLDQLDRLVAAATPASSSIQCYCADCAPAASPRPPDHSS